MEVTHISKDGERTVTRRKPKGKLMIIGGAERNHDGLPVLKAVAEEIRLKRHPLLIVTAATYEPASKTQNEYIRLFKELGVHDVQVMDIRSREDAYDEANVAKVAHACGVFFSGGDQLRITSQIGDSPVYRTLVERYVNGCIIAGTSAGAAAIPNTMIIGGPGEASNRISSLAMAPGLGLLDRIVIDSHFAERGRMGRLLGAVAQNPSNLGVGIDESTGILVTHGGDDFTVVGSGAVYVVDGTDVSYSSLSEENAEGVISIHDVKIHVLGEGERYDLIQRRPIHKSMS